MIEQRIVNDAVDRYHRLDEVLRSRVLKDEEAAFLRGRKHELMLLIYTLDEQAITQLTENPVDNKPELVNISRIREVNLN